jgi:hypothetical protein
MIRILFGYKQNDLLLPFLERQIEEANLEGIKVSKFTLELNPMMVEHYDITKHHTVIFKDFKDNELLRIEEPFDSKRLEEGLFHAKGILANRLKSVVL